MAGLPANIANFVKQEIRIAKTKPLLPVFEAVSNALDSIRERDGGGKIWVTVIRQPDSVFDGSRGDPYAFFVDDDGVGFTEANMAGFDQLYTRRGTTAGKR